MFKLGRQVPAAKSRKNARFMLPLAPEMRLGMMASFRKGSAPFMWQQYKTMAVHAPETLSAQHHTVALAACLADGGPPQRHEGMARVVFNRNITRPCIRDVHSMLSTYWRSCNHLQLLETINETTKSKKEIQALKIQKETNLQPQISLTCYNYRMAISLSENNIEELIRNWRDCVAEFPVSRNTNMDGWAYLIEGYAKSNDVENAVGVYNHIKEKVGARLGDEPTNALIRAYAYPSQPDSDQGHATSQLDKSVLLFNESYGKLIKDTKDLDVHLRSVRIIYAYDALIEACCISNEFKAAIFHWNALLGYCNVALTKLKANHKLDLKRSHQVVHPTPTTAIRLMILYKFHGRLQEVNEVFQYLASIVKCPDPFAYNLALRANLDLGTTDIDYQYAVNLYINLRKSGTLCDEDIYQYFAPRYREYRVKKMASVLECNTMWKTVIRVIMDTPLEVSNDELGFDEDLLLT